MPPKKSKGAKKRAAKQKYSGNLSNQSQSDCSDSEYEPKPSQKVESIPIIVEGEAESLPEASGPRTSLLSQQATALQIPQTISEPVVQTPPARPTVVSEQQLSQSIKNETLARPKSRNSRNSPRNSPSGSGGSFSRSLPRRLSIPRAATPASLFQQSLRKSLGESDSEREEIYSQAANEILTEHLVQANDISDPSKITPFGSLSHNLQGGAITRDIYKWQETRQTPIIKARRNSHPNLGTRSDNSTLAEIRQPGGFRRHFIANRAQSQGKKPPSFLTKNFMDFLILYGFYGGDVYPTDDEMDSDDEYAEATPDVEAVTETAPLLQRQSSMSSLQGTSESKAFFMLLKAFVGTGVLFLPKAFLNGGLVFSLIVMTALGILTTHCMLLLVDCSRKFGNKSFGELAELIYGEKFKLLVLGSITVSQLGFCCAYMIFVGQNLRDLVMLTTNCKWILPDWFFILAQIMIYIPLAWIRKIKKFGITSLVADVFILLGLAYIFFFGVSVIFKNGMQPVTFIKLDTFPLFIGTAMFSFEGICLMLPIAESMKKPENFTRVVISGMITIAAIFMVIGTLGFLALGQKVETNIFLNLPISPAVLSIQFFYAMAILLSFPLALYPATKISEQWIFGLRTGRSSNIVKWKKNFYRVALVFSLGLVSFTGAYNLDKVVSLVGCLCCIPLSFIYPALFHSHITENKWVKLKDWSIVFFGTLATIYTTAITIEKIASGAADIPLDRCQ